MKLFLSLNTLRSGKWLDGHGPYLVAEKTSTKRAAESPLSIVRLGRFCQLCIARFSKKRQACDEPRYLPERLTELGWRLIGNYYGEKEREKVIQTL